jgi:hypothetical protein
MVCFSLESEEKNLFTFSAMEIFEKNQSRTFEKLNTLFCSELDANSKYIQIYVYLSTKSRKKRLVVLEHCNFWILMKFRNAVFIENEWKKLIKLYSKLFCSIELVEFYLAVSFMHRQCAASSRKTYYTEVSLRNFIKNTDGLLEHFIIS